jgi:hypothetical protein
MTWTRSDPLVRASLFRGPQRVNRRFPATRPRSICSPPALPQLRTTPTDLVHTLPAPIRPDFASGPQPISDANLYKNNKLPPNVARPPPYHPHIPLPLFYRCHEKNLQSNPHPATALNRTMSSSPQTDPSPVRAQMTWWSSRGACVLLPAVRTPPPPHFFPPDQAPHRTEAHLREKRFWPSPHTI